jgi:hypothetical protein
MDMVWRMWLPGGMWKIEAAYIADGGKRSDGSVVEGTQIPVTFDSSITRLVLYYFDCRGRNGIRPYGDDSEKQRPLWTV